jgi:hypothetical protein
VRCDHEHDDGAYVIGALSPAERAAYERHLNTCSFCREAVADLAVIPGLLGRLDPADFARLLEPDPPKVVNQRNRMPALVTAAQLSKRRERHRSRRRTLGAALVAAALALIVGGGGLVIWQDGNRRPGDLAGTPAVAADTVPELPMVRMQPVAVGTPITAQLNLTDTAWGTMITMKCAYAKTGTSTRISSFRLIAYGPDDTREEVGSWAAAPGSDLTIPGATRFGSRELSRLELVRHDNTPILAYDVP